MLLQYLFRLRQTQQRAPNTFLPKNAVHYLRHLKSNNIIGQRKTSNKKKTLTMIDFV